MVHRRKDRPNEGWRVKLALPRPWDTEVVWQTGLRARREALQVDAWIREQVRARPEIVDAILARRFTLQEAWIGYRRGSLDELLGGIGDPLLAQAVEEFRPVCTDARARAGLEQLLARAPVGARLSWLDRRMIAQLYAHAVEEGQRPNSVRRSLHRAVSELLRHHLGEQGRGERFAHVRIPSEDDDRIVQVTPDEVAAVIRHAQPERFRWLVVAAIATAVDRGPLQAVTPRDVHDELLVVADRKTRHRPRIIPLSGDALTAFRLASLDRARDEPLWGEWTPGQIRHMWETARDLAAGRPTRGVRRYRGRGGYMEGLPDPAGERAEKLYNSRRIVTLPILRFKDLRHLLPTTLAELGADRRMIQAILGHRPGSKQTDRYITPAGTVEVLGRASAALGLTGWHARAG